MKVVPLCRNGGKTWKCFPPCLQRGTPGTRIVFSFQSGFMPNVFSGLSYRPDELRAFLNYYEVVMAERGNADFISK